MRLFTLAFAALLAAAGADAREPKKKPEAPPPSAPVIEYEMEDPHMGGPLSEACLGDPAEQETYDSRDNVLITKLEGGGRAFFHFRAGCDANTMMFADAIAVDGGSRCVRPGGSLVFTSSFGDSKKCVVDRINAWNEDEPITPYEE